MGEFYGVNLFLAESSATTGGLDSLLEPTGNIKVAQDKAARALGGDRTFFVTNGTSTSNKIVHQALLQLKAEGKLDRAKMLVLTNCTFDGHVANVERTMLECLAIKPDLIFLWDEAWFGYARFSPFLRRRTGMGAAAKIREMMRDPAYRERHAAFKSAVGEIDIKNRKVLDTPLLPDPDK